MRCTRFLPLGVCLLLAAGACEPATPVDDWTPLNLLQYEVPATVLAPAGTNVRNDNLGILQDVKLTGEDGYDVQIYASEALETDAATVLTDQRQEVESMRYFADIVEDQPDGFLFRMAVDTANVSYDFRHVRIIGDRELIFRTGLTRNASEAEARRMFEAVRYRK